MNEPVIITNPARCRDCYRCVRYCDFKAIRVRDGQAQVVPELCIVCGTCIRTCPQKAKDVPSATPDIKQALKEGRRLIASVAPSAPAYFNFHVFSDMEAALQKLGFSAAEETALGAEIVGTATREYVERFPQTLPVISSSCPVIISLIAKYYPDLLSHLAPFVSPMIAHGKLLRHKYGDDAYIVFIGPCLAKKTEIHDPAIAGVVSAAMTFRSLAQWLSEKNISLPTNPGRQVEPVSADARLFPVEGGLSGTARMSTDILARDLVVASGPETCRNVLGDIRTGQLNVKLVEIMACPGGCINGPAMADLPNGIFVARQKIIDYHQRRPVYRIPDRKDWPNLSRAYEDRKIEIPEYTEEQIQDVMRRISKFTAEDELNCGACGYSSCREKAIATLRGMAEITMCVQYMRRRSESLRQVVMDVSPNAIIILDDQLVIQDISPSAERMFGCRLEDLKGKHISRLVPIYDDFITVRDTGESIIGKVRRINDRIVVEQNIVRVGGQPFLVAIMRDITELESEKQNFRQLRSETLEQTREVVRKQMRVAHEIAHLLGETAAESKMIVSHLAKLLEEEEVK